jgi:hypothetical protein
MTSIAAHNQHLSVCADYLRAALRAENPIPNTMQGLCHLMAAVAPGLPLEPGLKAEVSTLLFGIAPIVTEAMSGRMTAENIAFSLGCANASMDCTTAPRCLHLVLYTGVLEADLKSALLRDEIIKGGEPDLIEMLRRNANVPAPFWPGTLPVH